MQPSTITFLVFIALTLFLITIYVIILAVCYQKKVFIFAPYTPVPLPNSFMPLGTITQLTPDEVATRAANIAAALKPTT